MSDVQTELVRAQQKVAARLERLESAQRVIIQARVTTTDATQTTLYTFTLPASTTYLIEATVVARRTGGSSGSAEDGAGYVVRGVYKNVGGTATLIGAVSQIFVAESQGGWDATLTVSGGSVLLRVTGAANNSIAWLAEIRITQVSS
jgi:hypothetical protein